MLRSNNARGRIGLLASSSLVASTLLTGLAGVALTAFTPAVALASCTPDPAGTSAAGPLPGSGGESCSGTDTGVYYDSGASAGITLLFQGETVTTNGVGVGNATNANNIVFGVETGTVTGGNITNTGGAGVTLDADGGDVEIDTGTSTAGAKAGVTVTGSTDGIDTITTGAGTTLVNVLNTVTGTTGAGININAGTGNVTVTAMTNTGGPVAINGGSGGILVTGGGDVAITAPGTVSGGTGGAIFVSGATGDVTIKSNVATSTGGNGIFVIANGNISETTTGDSTGGLSSFGAGGQLGGAADNFSLTTGGQVIDGVNVATEASTGNVTLNLNGNVTIQGVTVGAAIGGQGSATTNIALHSGNVTGVDPLTGAVVGVFENGPISITTAVGTDISGAGIGVDLVGGSGNITGNIAGTVGGAGAVGGTGVNATTAVGTTSTSINLTVAAVNASGVGVNVNNGGTGVTSVHATGNITSGGDGIDITSFNGTTNTPGDTTVTLDGNVTIAAGGSGISATAFGGGNINVNLGANVTIGAAGGTGHAGILATGLSTGDINITTATKDDQTGQIAASGAGADGIQAIQAGTGGINIDFGGNIGNTTTNIDGDGIDAEITNAANASSINVRAGNVSVDHGVGIFAQTVGAGDVNVTTLKGTDVSSQNGDGIDAFAMGGGNVTVTLLDGSVHSNASGSASGIFTTGGVSGSGPSAPGPKPSAPSIPDPHSVHMIAMIGGTATLNQNSDVTNEGDGDAVLSSTVDGANTLNINANITNNASFLGVGGNGALATTSGLGNVTINLFNNVTPSGEANQTQNAVNVITVGGSGILAQNTDPTINGTFASVITTAGAPGPLTVTVTSANTGSVGIGATIASEDGLADVDLRNAPSGGNVSVEGNGSNVGIEAVAGELGEFGGSAEVFTNANLTISVGTAGGNNDVGVLASVADGADGGRLGAAATLGDGDIITVGSTGSAGGVGVLAEGLGAGLDAGDSATVAAGNLEHITVNGAGAIGVEAFVAGGFTFGNPSTDNITIGDGGAIVVHDTAGTPGTGVLGNDQATVAGANTSITIGTTSVTVDHGNGVVGLAVGTNTATVSDNGNVTAGGNGTMAVTDSGAATNSYNATGTGNATMNFGGAVGVGAVATTGNASATVNIGNAVGDTTVHGTNTTIATIGVLASATGTGNALIDGGNNINIDPTEFAMQSITPAGQANITLGTGGDYVVDDPTLSAPLHIGLYATTGATADTAAGPSSVVSIGNNSTISVEANLTSTNTDIGIGAFNTGNGVGSVSVSTGGNTTITVDGADAAGIAATTVGTDGAAPLGAATGNGDVTVASGTGQITVGTSTTNFDYTPPNQFAATYGIFTATDGGNVSVTNGASITATNFAGNNGAPGFGSTNTIGIQATTSGKGSIDIGAATGGTLITTQVGDGIFAGHTGGGSGAVNVGGGANGLIQESITTGEPNTSGFAAGNGIEATTNGSGTVTVSQGNLSKITTLGTAAGNKGTANVGIFASNTAGVKFFGDVDVNVAGTITTNQTTGNLGGTAGNSSVAGTATALVGGQGVLAETNGNGNINVDELASGNITTTGASDGIDAVNTGGANGNVGVTVSGAITSGGSGVLAYNTSNDDTLVTVSGGNINAGGFGVQALELNATEGTVTIQTTGNSNIAGALSGAVAETVGAGVVTVNNGVAGSGFGGTISSTGGDGIVAANADDANSGNVFVDNEGNVTGAGGEGILAEVTNSANGASVQVRTGSVNATGDGVFAETFGGQGGVSVTVNPTTNGSATLVTSSAGNGVVALTTGGFKTSDVSVNINGATSGNLNGVVGQATGSSTVFVTGNSTITGATGDGVQTLTNAGTNTVHLISGTASSTVGGNGVNAQTDGNGKIQVTIDSGATAEGGSGNTVNNNGVLAMAGGSGTVNVLLNGNAGTKSPLSGWGVNAVGDGGLVTVTENASGTVTDGGIRAVNLQPIGGSATVTLAGNTTNTGQDGVLVETGTGSANVTLKGNAQVTANTVTGQNGVEVDTTTGPVTVTDTSPNTLITANQDGILGAASAAGGTVNITYDGVIDATGGVGAGIAASTDNGLITIQTGIGNITGANGIVSSITTGAAQTHINTGSGTVTGTTADGIHAVTDGTGLIDIATTGNVVAQVNGIFAMGTTGEVEITNSGAVTGQTGSGLAGFTGGAGTIQINVQGPVSDGIGIQTSQSGSGTTNIVDGVAGDTVTGTIGDGIQALNGSGNGTVNVGSGTGSRFIAPVSGNLDGIDIGGAGTMNVFTEGGVTGNHGWGISAVSTGGPVSIDVTGGNITGSASGGTGGGILGETAGSAAVTITNTTSVLGLLAGSDGIEGLSTGNGAVNIASTGPLVTGANDAIVGASSGGAVTVGTVGAPILSVLGDATTTNAAIQTQNSTGTTLINTAASASMAGDVNAAFGIESLSNTGQVTINNAAQIGSAGAGNGVNNTGISVDQTGATATNGISITNSGAIFADGKHNGGGIVALADSSGTGGNTGITVMNTANITVTNGATHDYGIDAVNTGTAAVVITNTATIDPPYIGMRARNGGNATVNDSGNTTATHTGLVAITTGGAAFTATVNVTGNANITGINHDGIFAGGFGGNVLVNTLTGGTIKGGDNGIQSIVTGSGVTTVNTNDTIIGQDGWGIASESIGAGNVTVNAGSGGSVTGTGSGGILALTTNGSSVTVNGNTTIKGLGAGTDGIEAVSEGTGAVTVASTGPLVTGANDAILGSSAGGPVVIGTAGAPITSQVGDTTTLGAGIEADNTTGTISVVNHGDMSQDGNANFGILAQNTGSGANTIGITNTGAIGNSSVGGGVNDAGILALESNSAATGTITINNSGNIFADTNGGVKLPVGFGTATGTVGVGAVSMGNANISITNSGVIDPPAFGVLAVTKGNILIANSGNITATVAGIDGISIGGGNVGISNTAATINVSAGNGIDAGSFLGNGSININQGLGSITASDTAIQVLSAGGPVTVISQGTETGTAGNGIAVSAFAGGNLGSIDVNTSAGGNVFGGTNGIITAGSGGGTTTINTLTNGGFVTATNVTGAGGDGISASTTGTGNVTVTAGNTFGSGAAGDVSTGIAAASTGGTVSVAATGNVEGDMTGNTGGTGAAGISAVTTGGNGSVSVAVNDVRLFPLGTATSSVVVGGNDGILASSTGTGNTTVTVQDLGGGEIDATGATSVDGGLGPVGISATGGSAGGNIGNATSVSITSDADIFAVNGRAIVTNAANNATITTNGYVVGLGSATTSLGGTLTGNVSYAVVDVTTVSGATTTFTNGFDTGSDRALFGGNDSVRVAGLSDLAVRGTTGSVVIDNNGGLYGRVNFAGLTGTNTSSIVNDNLWDTNGTSTFSPTGNASIDNSGVILTSTDQVRTTLAFGTATNTITNEGGSRLVVGFDEDSTGTAAAPAVTQITGTVSFTNNGTIILGASGGATTSDRLINSVLSGTGTTLGGTGQIDLDANLWSDTQSAAACEAFVLTAADCVVIGHSTGNNGIQVLDTKAHALGAYNPVGITIVVGSSAANTFHLANTSDYFDGNPADAFLYGGHTNVLDKPGMFFYDLAYAPSDSTERLIGVPKATAFEFPTVEGAADSVWYTTTQTWFDRTTDLRDSLQGRADGTEPGVWLKAVGDWTHRNQSSSFSDPVVGYTAVFNTSYDQDTAGLLGGVDLLNVTGKNTAWVLGVETGTVQSDLRFTASPDTFGITATDLGGYATYLNGGLFVDGTFNANFLRLNANLPSEVMLPGGGLSGPPATNNIHGTSWGGQVEAGYNMPLGAMAFWEPVGSLSYVDTSFDQLPVLGGTDAMGHDQSFRGSLGLRLGVNQDFQYYKIKLAVTGRVWDEFDNDPTATLIVPGGVDFTSNDDLKGVFGEVSGQANLFSTTSGLSAFLTGGVKFKSNYDEGTVTLGARYQF